MRTLVECLNALAASTAPQRLKSLAPDIARRFGAFHRYREKTAEPIYGTNTLPGHRDNEMPRLTKDIAFQDMLIDRHCVGGPPYLDELAARAVTLAKAYSCVQEGVVLSRPLFEVILDAAFDPAFAPAIPANASYSCGDVIPAAHWARALLDHSRAKGIFTLSPGEAMMLINGAFIHVGAAVALSDELRAVWARHIETIAVSASVISMDARAFAHPRAPAPAWADDCAAYIASRLSGGRGTRQDPVSYRAIPQMIAAVSGAIELFLAETDSALNRPSGNPLFYMENDEPHHAPGGSFLELSLAIATGGLIEAFLLAAWASCERTSRLLEGRYNGLPLDGMTADDPLGLIQWPKLSRAKLESMRRRYAGRTFVSGSSTSHGVEDLWSFGLETTRQARAALREFDEIVALEAYCAISTAKAAGGFEAMQAVYGPQMKEMLLQQSTAADVAHVIESKARAAGIPFAI